MNKIVCSIIVTYNIGEDLLRCFDSIKNQTEEVIIVDNGSDSETISVLKTLEQGNDDVAVFYNEDNLGIGAALNIGVRYAIKKGYEWILTLDHDSEATPDLVENLLAAYKTLIEQGIEKIAVIGANLFDTNIQSYMTSQRLFSDGDIKEVRGVLTSGSLIKSCVFEEVGFFNEGLFLYFVDDDFCLRCKNNGWSIYVYRSAVLYHREGIKEVRKFLWREFIYRNYNFYARYYMSRNAIYMLKSYFRSGKYYNCCKIFERLCSQALKIALFGKKRTTLFYFMLKGIYDGIVGKFGGLAIDNKKG